MSGNRPLDEFLDDLRQPARVSELVGESKAVAAITSALMSAPATPVQAPRSASPLRIASFVAAGVIGFGGVAAAGPSLIDTVTGHDEPQLDQPTETTERADQGADIPTAVDDLVVDELADDPDTAFDETICADGTHGQTVSSVAQATPSKPGKGEIVAEAAQSSCGKDHESDDAEVAEQVADDPDTAFDEAMCADGNHGQTVSSIAQATPSKPGKGEIVAEAAQSSCGKDQKSEAAPTVDRGSGDEADNNAANNNAGSNADHEADKANTAAERGADKAGNNAAERGAGNSKEPRTKKSTND